MRQRTKNILGSNLVKMLIAIVIGFPFIILIMAIKYFFGWQ